MTTLDYYNVNAQDFAERTVNADMSSHYERFLPLLPPSGRILDLGCGSGRDSKAFLERDFDVISLDGSSEMCRIAGEYLGRDVLCMDFSSMNFDAEFDGIWASASLLHVPQVELPDIIARVERALKPEGVFYASFKYGTGERTKEERFFNDKTEADIPEILAGTDLALKEYWITADVRPEKANERWLNIIAQKV